MKIDEIVTLATNGYSVDDIRELEEQYPDFTTLAISGKSLSEIKAYSERAVKEDPQTEEQGTSQVKDQESDYKSLYDDLSAKYSEMESTLKQIQHNNLSINHSQPGKEIDPQEQLNNLFREFM